MHSGSRGRGLKRNKKASFPGRKSVCVRLPERAPHAWGFKMIAFNLSIFPTCQSRGKEEAQREKQKLPAGNREEGIQDFPATAGEIYN